MFYWCGRWASELFFLNQFPALLIYSTIFNISTASHFYNLSVNPVSNLYYSSYNTTVPYKPSYMVSASNILCSLIPLYYFTIISSLQQTLPPTPYLPLPFHIFILILCEYLMISFLVRIDTCTGIPHRMGNYELMYAHLYQI